MSNPAQCFDSVIGLTRNECQCYTDLPADAADSASELWLDETPGLDLQKLFSAASCGNTAGQMMSKARDEGLKSTRDELLRYVTSNTIRKRPELIGRSGGVGAQIGDDSKSSKTVALGYSYHGLSVMFAHHVGGTFTLKRIGTKFRSTGTITVSVYDMNAEDRDTPIATRAVSIQQNRSKFTDIEPIVHSLETETSQNPWFHFLFEPSGEQAMSVLIDKSDCGCGGRTTGRGLQWNSVHPWFESGVKMNGQSWTLWAMAAGTRGNDLTTREDWNVTNETQGLMLGGDFSCNALTAICNGDPDYLTDPIQVAYAHAVRYRSAMHLIDILAAGTAVDRDALLGGEAIGKMRQQYSSDFKRLVEYMGGMLSKTPDEGNPKSGVNTYSDCFTCDPGDEPRVQTIRV